MINPKRKRNALFLDNIPEDTRDGFKSACARRGKTMKAVLVQFMQDYAVKNPVPPAGNRRN